MMGMTIDNIIKELLINKEDDTYVLGNEIIDSAIDTMRKYQKIEDLWNRCHTFDHDKYFQMIGQIIEKGDIQIH